MDPNAKLLELIVVLGQDVAMLMQENADLKQENAELRRRLGNLRQDSAPIVRACYYDCDFEGLDELLCRQMQNVGMRRLPNAQRPSASQTKMPLSPPYTRPFYSNMASQPGRRGATATPFPDQDGNIRAEDATAGGSARLGYRKHLQSAVRLASRVVQDFSAQATQEPQP